MLKKAHQEPKKPCADFVCSEPLFAHTVQCPTTFLPLVLFNAETLSVGAFCVFLQLPSGMLSMTDALASFLTYVPDDNSIFFSG